MAIRKSIPRVRIWQGFSRRCIARQLQHQPRDSTIRLVAPGGLPVLTRHRVESSCGCGFAEINVELFIGQGGTANGSVEVSGVSSSGQRSTLVVDNLNDASFIRIGTDGATSRLDIADGALVQVGNAVFVGNLFTATGNHTFTIGGTQGGFSAELRAKFFTVSGPGASADINDGALVVLSSNTPFSQLQAFNSSELNINGGEVFAPQVARDAGSTINWTGGILHTEEVQNDLTNAGGTLAPGLGQAVTLGTTSFLSDYTQTAAGTLEIEIAGNTQGTEFDFVDVNGQISLAGTLEVVLLGPTPSVGDTFDILDWNSITGTFDTLLLPGVGNGNTWDLDQLYSAGTISVIRSGDLNSDGVVGVADLGIILANWGQSVTPFDETSGDVNGDGTVGTADLLAVQEQFGNTTYPSTSSIPEPGSLSLLGFLGASWHASGGETGPPRWARGIVENGVDFTRRAVAGNILFRMIPMLGSLTTSRPVILGHLELRRSISSPVCCRTPTVRLATRSSR